MLLTTGTPLYITLHLFMLPLAGRCGNNYGWSRFEGSRCQVALEDLYGSCLDADRTGFTFPYFEYCHPGYSDNADNEENYRGGTDICGSRLITGNSVIGTFTVLTVAFVFCIGHPPWVSPLYGVVCS